MAHRYECLDEVISIYPITPASPMAEQSDDWAAAGRPNPWRMSRTSSRANNMATLRSWVAPLDLIPSGPQR